jgi:hypothetical protein
MIRRWSCLITLNNNFNDCSFFKKNHKTNVFKNSVNFKRFSFKSTKLKRKSLIRIKHQSTLLIYTNVIKLWTKDYIFNKNYIKSQFYKNIYINNFIFYNFNFVKNRSENFFYNFNFIFSTFTNKNYYYFFNNNLINLKNSPITTAWYLFNPINTSSIIPVYSNWDNQLFQFNINKSYTFEISDLFDSIFFIILKKNTEIRKILILLYYFNILQFKKVK